MGKCKYTEICSEYFIRCPMEDIDHIEFRFKCLIYKMLLYRESADNDMGVYVKNECRYKDMCQLKYNDCPCKCVDKDKKEWNDDECFIYCY